MSSVVSYGAPDFRNVYIAFRSGGEKTIETYEVSYGYVLDDPTWEFFLSDERVMNNYFSTDAKNRIVVKYDEEDYYITLDGLTYAMYTDEIDIDNIYTAVPTSTVVDPEYIPSPLTLTMSTSNFSVTLPTNLSVSVAANGTVTSATNAKIVNNSNGPVKISNVALENKNGWTLKKFNTNFKAEQVDAKVFGFKLNNIDAYNGDILSSFTESIEGGEEKSFTYTAALPARSTALNATIADVVFTVVWDSVEAQHSGGNGGN